MNIEEKLKNIRNHILSVLNGGDILFIVPPFALFESPVPGVHLLQSIAEERGYKTEILYLNVLLASVTGRERFERITFPPDGIIWAMLHERLFCRSAYGMPPLGESPEYCLDEAMSVSGGRQSFEMLHEYEAPNLEEYRELETLCYAFTGDAAAAVASLNYKMAGCTARIGQTNCSVALLNHIKRIRPGTLTLMGGANCYGELAQGIASLSPSIDVIFSGESEGSFRDFLDRYARGETPTGRIIHGEPPMDLDELPLPDYSCFYHQTRYFLRENYPERLAVCYETSRGCWWGEKQKCRFCAYKGAYREKSAGKILEDLNRLARSYPVKTVYMCDNVIPPLFEKEVLPVLKDIEETPSIYFMIRANLGIDELMRLKEGRVNQVTPGIEALSTGLLNLMNKGTTARQNLQLLRHARSVGINMDWLLLWGFPGDKIHYYQETLRLLPLIRHLQPPLAFWHLLLSRYSPYLENPGEFRIDSIRPWAVYQTIYPHWADIDKLAYWFAGDYVCDAHENPRLIKDIAEEVTRWKQLWETTHLAMIPFNDYYMILDNRDARGKKTEVVDLSGAREIMTASVYNGSQHQKWALEKELGVLADSWYVPLVTASPDLLIQFREQENTA